MDEETLRPMVEAIIQKRRHEGQRPHELMRSINRRKLDGSLFRVIEPLLHGDVTYKEAIDIAGKMKNAPAEVSDAIEDAWNRSWFDGVPQACTEAFRALLKLGNNDERLLAMVERAIQVDNYGIHRECAEALMKIQGGDLVLRAWGDTIAGKCDCHLHRKLFEKIKKYLAS